MAAVLPEQVFVGAEAMAKGIPDGTSEPIASDPGGKMPGHRSHRFAEAKRQVRPAFHFLQICFANLREGWLKRAG